jgi:CBS domain-containing membrane protein
VSLTRVDDPSRRVLLASLGAALFILSLGALDDVTRGAVDLPTLIPPFGASTVIVFFAPDSAASRAWAVLVGHLGSALVASAVLLLMPASPVVVQAAVAVAGAGVWMVLSKSVHPPGGATALLAALGGQKLGMGAILLPLLAGCTSLVSIRWVLDRGIGLWTRSVPLRGAAYAELSAPDSYDSQPGSLG